MNTKILFISLILILLLSGASSAFDANTWSYVKKINITGETGVGTNYQVELEIGDNAGGDFHLEGHCTNFPQDIIVTDDDGVTPIDFFIEDVGADPIIMHVEVRDNLTFNQTIWVYYGKSGAITTSNGTTTFLQYHGVANSDYLDAVSISGNFSYRSNITVSVDSHDIIWGVADVQTVDHDELVFDSYDTDNVLCILSKNDGAYTYHLDTPSMGDETPHIYKIVYNSSIDAKFYRDNIKYLSTITTNLPNENLGLVLKVYSGAITQTWAFISNYNAFEPAFYNVSDEELVLPGTAIPPDPTNIDHTTGNFWVNHTWSQGSGNVTDSYNVSVNGVWYNNTIVMYNNTVVSAHAWVNISVYAFNSSNTGTLSLGNVTQDTQIPNNPVTIINASDWSGDAGDTVYVDYDGTDADTDTLTFSCNRTDLFTDFNTSSGTGNWTSTTNIYYVDFGVSDGYGSISNYTMILWESSIKNGITNEIKSTMFEISFELSDIKMGDYLVYAFFLIGILLIIFCIQIITNGIHRG